MQSSHSKGGQFFNTIPSLWQLSIFVSPLKGTQLLDAHSKAKTCILQKIILFQESIFVVDDC